MFFKKGFLILVTRIFKLCHQECIKRMSMVRKVVILFCLLVFAPCWSISQDRIEGRVTDRASKQPLPGATIRVMQHDRAAITGQQGYFDIQLPPGVDSLHISYVGYQSQRIKVSEGAGFISVALKPRQHSIREVVVKGTIRSSNEMLFHRSHLPARALEQEMVASNTSVYDKLTRLPGVAVEKQDISGLSEKSVRIRGIRSLFTGMTLEGVPNYGIMPIGPRDYLYDMENIRSLSLYKGSIPADVLSATGNKGGVIRLDFKRPADDFGILARQSMGSDNYARSFLRVDAGRLPGGVSLFGSYSYTRSDKWKGFGQVGPRHNMTLGVSKKFNDELNFELYGLYNHLERHDFRELDYDQAKNIQQAYDHQFLNTPSGDASYKAFHYDNNKGSFSNIALYGDLQYRATDNLILSIKPYVSQENAGLWHKQITGPPSSPNYMLFNRHRDDHKTGVVGKISLESGVFDVSAGYWGERNDLEARVRVYRLRDDQAKEDLGINPLTKNVTPGFIHNPYVRLTGSPGKWSWHAGLKYFYYTSARTENYSKVGDERTSLPSMNVGDVDYSAWLPSLGVGYLVNGKLQLSLSYGKNYMRPYMYGPMRSLYLRNKDAFLDKEVTYQKVLESWKMETSDQLTFRAAWQGKRLNLEVGPFMAWHHNVLTPVMNPDVGVEYPQNVGEVEAYGVEGQANIMTPWNIMLFVNGTWMHMGYAQNILVGRGGNTELLEIKGNQSPSVPRFSGYAGFRYSPSDVSFSTRFRYVGDRYGDATNREKISSYYLLHLQGSYRFDVSWARELSIGWEIKNLLNTRYVGRIVSMDYEHSGNPTYYAGMPRSFALTVTTRF